MLTEKKKEEIIDKINEVIQHITNNSGVELYTDPEVKIVVSGNTGISMSHAYNSQLIGNTSNQTISVDTKQILSDLQKNLNYSNSLVWLYQIREELEKKTPNKEEIKGKLSQIIEVLSDERIVKLVSALMILVSTG